MRLNGVASEWNQIMPQAETTRSSSIVPFRSDPATSRSDMDEVLGKRSTAPASGEFGPFLGDMQVTQFGLAGMAHGRKLSG